MPCNARSLCASPQPSKPPTSSPSSPSSPMHPSTPLYIPTSSLSLPNHPRETPRHRPLLNVVVTGGSTGIGEAIVTVFAQAGHRVLFTYLTRRTNAERLQSRYRHVTATQLDQAQVDSVAAFSRTVDHWAGPAGVHVLVNNAALGSATVRQYVHQQRESPNLSKFATEQLPSSAVDMLQRAQNDLALMRVNALGPLWVTDALSDSIHRAADNSGRATIIFIGSVGGGSSAVFPEYCAADLMSKAALTYFSKHLAAQHVRDNIDVLCLSPGATETDMFRQSTLSTIPDVPAFVDSMPKRRLIQPHEIAKSVFWLSVESPPGVFHGSVLDASMGLATTSIVHHEHFETLLKGAT